MIGWIFLFRFGGMTAVMLLASRSLRIRSRAIGHARQLNGIIAGFGVRELQAVDGYHIPYDAKIVEERTKHLKEADPNCGAPKGEPLASYGAAPAADFVELARKFPSK